MKVYMYLRFKFKDPCCFYYFLEENVPFRGFDDQGVDLRRGGFDVAGVVDAGFEGAAGGGRGREDGHGVVVERHDGEQLWLLHGSMVEFVAMTLLRCDGKGKLDVCTVWFVAIGGDR